MKLGEIIRQKRKEQNLTQEQLSGLLGVSATAVHKWEKGTTYPDITALPILARALHTDLNTLLSFQEELTDEQIARFTDHLGHIVQEEGYEAAFQLAMDKLQEYPTCEKLHYVVIFYLDGARYLHGVPNPEEYTDQLIPFYERLSRSCTPQIRDAAIQMCIAYHRNRKEFEQAEALIRTLPDAGVDKEEQLAILYTQQERSQEAQKVWEYRILKATVQIQTALSHLMDIACKENSTADAEFYAQVYEQISQYLCTAKWMPYIAKFQLASLNKDRKACLLALRQIIPSLAEPLNPHSNRLYHTINGSGAASIALQLRSRLLNDLEHSEEFAFFRDSPEYEQLQEMLHDTKNGI